VWNNERIHFDGRHCTGVRRWGRRDMRRGLIAGIAGRGQYRAWTLALGALPLLLAAPPGAGGAAIVAADGTVPVPSFKLPMSSFASAAAGRRLHEILTTPQPSLGDDIATLRTFYDRQNSARLELMLGLYKVHIGKSKIAGVAVQIVEPAGGVPAANAKRVLVNLHGGAFMWGAGSGELVEAVPVAATLRVKVITVDYRMAPEHAFPAASEDVYALYRALLQQYKPANIGVYGCSAGGVLTAQVVAWIIDKGAPVPGAIGTFCSSGLDLGGDSSQLDPPINGHTPISDGGSALTMARLPYFDGAAAGPLLTPGDYPTVLARFPPTLLLAGSRDFAASSLTVMHRRLAAAGVRSELYLFDGLWHAFFVDADLPESLEAYKLICDFFDRNLGR
jgi:epsilon-lactone hydrolase